MRGVAIFCLLSVATLAQVEAKAVRHHHHSLEASEAESESEWKFKGGSKCCRCLANSPGLSQMWGKFWPSVTYCTVDVTYSFRSPSCTTKCAQWNNQRLNGIGGGGRTLKELRFGIDKQFGASAASYKHSGSCSTATGSQWQGLQSCASHFQSVKTQVESNPR